MKRIHMLLVPVLVLGISTFVYSQEPREPKAPPQPEEPRDAAPPRAEEPKAPKAEKQESQKPEAQKSEKENSKPSHGEKKTEGQPAHSGPAGKSAHIPEPKFKASFGRQHTFAVNQVVTQRTIVVGQTQFVYSGYTFIFLDPWPAEWAFTDDCYIDYIDDEYVLVDVLHPGVYVALSVVG